MTPLRSRFTMATVALFLVASSLTGCSSAPQALQQPTAKTLQSGVLGVSTAAAAGKYVVARAALTAVQADLRTAAAAGQVTPARANRIQGAIDLVGVDLAASIAASIPKPTPTPTPTPTESRNGDGNGNGSGNGDGGKRNKCERNGTCDWGDR